MAGNKTLPFLFVFVDMNKTVFDFCLGLML